MRLKAALVLLPLMAFRADSLSAGEAVSPREAAGREGEVVTVRGKVLKTGRTRRGGVLLAFDPDFRNTLCVLVPPRALGRFPEDFASAYAGKEVEARGKVVRLMEMPRLLVEEPAALGVVEAKEKPGPPPSRFRSLVFRLRRGLASGVGLCEEGEKERGLERLENVIRSSRGFNVRPILLRALSWKVHFLEEGGNLDSAEKAYRDAVEVFEEMRGEGEEETAEGKTPRVYEKLVALLAGRGKAEEALEYLDRSRSKALREQFGKLSVEFSDGAKKGVVEKAKRLEGEVAASEEELRAELSKPEAEQDLSSVERLEKTLSEKRRAYSGFIYEMKKAHPEIAGLFRVDPKDLRRQRERLPGGVALVEYLMGEESLYLFLVSAGDLQVRTVSVSEEALSAKIDFLLALVSDASLARSLGSLDPKTLSPEKADGEAKEAVSSFLEASEELYKFLLEPFEEALNGIRTVGIIPNGKLHSLPFGMLGKVEGGRFHPLVQKASVFCLTSLDRLGEAEAKGALRPAAFANADGTLPESEEEANALRGLYPEARLYIGNEATEGRAKASPASGLNSLHLAAHGRLLLNDMRRSFIQLAPGPGEDGRLTLEEVWGMDLGGNRIVVLSACETALGEDAVRGEVVSPASAFLEAGSRGVVSTLWKVPDRSTAELMKAFYGKLREGEGRAAALRAAKLGLASKPATAWPFYWAPFVLTGEWR